MSLLRTAARAAVAARVVGTVQRRQQQRWSAADARGEAVAAEPVAAATAPAPEPTVPAPASENAAAPVAPDPTQVLIEQLRQLGQLRDAGVLTPAEFDVQKQRLLSV